MKATGVDCGDVAFPGLGDDHLCLGPDVLVQQGGVGTDIAAMSLTEIVVTILRRIDSAIFCRESASTRSSCRKGAAHYQPLRFVTAYKVTAATHELDGKVPGPNAVGQQAVFAGTNPPSCIQAGGHLIARDGDRTLDRGITVPVGWLGHLRSIPCFRKSALCR